MNASPAALYLVNFSRLALPPPEPEPALQADPEPEPGCGCPTSDEIAHRIAAAEDRALDRALARSGADLEAALEAERQRGTQRLATERARWAAEEGDRLGALIVAGVTELEIGIAEVVARILRPVLDSARRDQAVAALREALASLRARGERPLMRIEGPPDLLRRLHGTGGDLSGVDYVEAETVDVRIVCDQTLIESRLGAWSQGLDGASA